MVDELRVHCAPVQDFTAGERGALAQSLGKAWGHLA